MKMRRLAVPQKPLKELGEACRGLCRLVQITATARPILTVLLSILCAAGGMLYAWKNLTFMTSTRNMLPQDQAYVQRDAEYADDFSETNDITVVVEAKNLPMAKAYAHRLVPELLKQTDEFKRVTYRIDPKGFESRQLLYLSTDELAKIRDNVFGYQSFMRSFAARPTLDQLIENIRMQVVSAFVSTFFNLDLDDGAAGSKDVDLGFVRDLLHQISTRLDRPAPYRSPWGSLFSVDADDKGDGYFLSDDKRLLFVLVESTDTRSGFTRDRDAIDALRGTIASLKADFPDVQVGVTGAPTLANDEMVAAFRDSERATILSFVLTLGLLLLAFRRIGMPILMLGTLTVSLCWSLGTITLVVGHLSIFSVMFISIVVGIGIDYGIYFLFRHDEEVLLGRNEGAALTITAGRSGPGMLSGALTAAGTFFVLMATDFLGIRELGFIAGISILSAWMSMMTLFPALIMLAGRHRVVHRDGSVPSASQLEHARVPFIERITGYPKTVMAGAGIVTLLALLALRNVYFDYNLLHLQALGTESVIWENRILATAGRSSYTGLATAGSLEGLRQKVAAFERLESVSEVDSVLQLIPEEQEAKQKIIGEFAPLVAPIRIGLPAPVDLDRLIGALQTLERRFDLAVGEAPAGRDRDDVVAVRNQTVALIRKLQQTNRDQAEPALTLLQRQVYRDFAHTFRRLQRRLQPQPIGLNDVPNEIRGKFIGRSGRLLLQIQPNVNIWDRAGAERLVTELRSVDPDVTGTPILTFESIRLMENGYKQGTVYAFALVGLLSALVIGRGRETLLAMLPLVLGTLWTVGLMYVFHLPFNLGNVFGFPLIIGAAAEFGLNIVLRYREGRERGGPLIARSTVMAVLLNGLTTIVGFGSLMIADHRGIFGLGLLLTLGLTSTLTASLIVLPVMLRWTESRAHPRRMVVQGPGLQSTGTV